jgi:hypothetical protein
VPNGGARAGFRKAGCMGSWECVAVSLDSGFENKVNILTCLANGNPHFIV